MRWESLNLHLENLLPGLVMCVLIALLLPNAFTAHFDVEPAKQLLASEFIAGGIFVATAYLLGILTVVVSRLVVDRLSEGFPRPFLLRLFSRGALAGHTRKEINNDYRTKIKIALASQNEEVKKEVVKRRERGRLVRTALAPTLLAVMVVTTSQPFPIQAAAAVADLVLFLFLYAYVEVTIYEECLLA